jgi:hypothetical protein
MSDAEVAAIILRLRVGMEQIRRRTMNDTGEWWPYIEEVHSNVEGLSCSRLDSVMAVQANEGDLIRFEIVGVNPRGEQSDLRYLCSAADNAWVDNRHFECVVPHQRRFIGCLMVADVNDLTNLDRRDFLIDVRPTG